MLRSCALALELAGAPPFSLAFCACSGTTTRNAASASAPRFRANRLIWPPPHLSKHVGHHSYLDFDVDQSLLCGSVQYGGSVIGGEGFHLGGDVHGTELGPAHGAEMRVFESVLGQGFIVHAAGGFGVERERELFLPVEAVAGAGERVVAIAHAGAVARDIGGVSSDLIGDNARLDVVAVG